MSTDEELTKAKTHIRELIALCGELAQKHALSDNSYMGDRRFLEALTYVADLMGTPFPEEVEMRGWTCPTCGDTGEADPRQIPMYCNACYFKPGEGKWVEVVWDEPDEGMTEEEDRDAGQ